MTTIIIVAIVLLFLVSQQKSTSPQSSSNTANPTGDQGVAASINQATATAQNAAAAANQIVGAVGSVASTIDQSMTSTSAASIQNLQPGPATIGGAAAPRVRPAPAAIAARSPQSLVLNRHVARLNSILKLVLLALLPLGLTGCMGLASSLQQLKQDPATVDLTVSTLYGSISLHRTVATNWVVAWPIMTNQPVVMPQSIATELGLTNTIPAK